MKMYCPQCGVKGSAEDSYLGRRIRCPKCSEIFTCERPKEEQEVQPETDSFTVEQAAAASGSEILESVDSFFDDETDEASSLEEDLSLTADSEETVAVEPELSLDDIGLEEAAAAAEELSRDAFSSEEFAGSEEDVEAEDADEEDGFEEEILLDPVADFSAEDEAEEIESWSDTLPDGELEAEEEEIEAEAAFDTVADLSADDGVEEIELSSDDLAGDELEVEAAGEDEADFDEELAAFFDETSGQESEEDKPETDTAEDGVIADADFADQLLAEDTDELVAEDEQQGEEPVIDTAGETAAGAVLPVFEAVQEEEKSDKKKRKKNVAEARVFSLEKFTVVGCLKEAWKYVKGAKLKLLIGIVISGILPSAVIDGFVSGFPVIRKSLAVTDDLTALYVLAAFILIGVIFAVAMQAGLQYTAVRWVADKPIAFKHLFSGLSKIFSIFFALVFIFLMTMSGLVLFVLPGIYLSIGYILTLPLIIDRGMNPWEAMEASRRAIHKVWWQVFGVLIVMSLLVNISAIPMGLGLIWTIPMSLIVLGVIYRYLFGVKE